MVNSFLHPFIAPPIPYGCSVTFDRSGGLVFRFSEKTLPLLFEWTSQISQHFGKLILEKKASEISEIDLRQRMPPTRREVLKREAAGLSSELAKLEERQSALLPMIQEAVSDAIQELERAAELEYQQENEEPQTQPGFLVDPEDLANGAS